MSLDCLMDQSDEDSFEEEDLEADTSPFVLKREISHQGGNQFTALKSQPVPIKTAGINFKIDEFKPPQIPHQRCQTQ